MRGLLRRRIRLTERLNRRMEEEEEEEEGEGEEEEETWKRSGKIWEECLNSPKWNQPFSIPHISS